MRYILFIKNLLVALVDDNFVPSLDLKFCLKLNNDDCVDMQFVGKA